MVPSLDGDGVCASCHENAEVGRSGAAGMRSINGKDDNGGDVDAEDGKDDDEEQGWQEHEEQQQIR